MIFLHSHFNIAQNWLNLLIDDRQCSNIEKLKRIPRDCDGHQPPASSHIYLTFSSLRFSIPSSFVLTSLLFPFAPSSLLDEERRDLRCCSASGRIRCAMDIFLSSLFVYIFDAYVSVLYRRLTALLVFMPRVV